MQIGVLGAGAIGCYLGASLTQVGNSVVLVGRQRLVDAVAEHGLHHEGLGGASLQAPNSNLRVTEDVQALADAEVVLVTVKSGQSREAAESLAAFLPTTTLVVSFQNGLRNADIIRGAMPEHLVLAGMVPFNVVWESPARFRQTTSGALVLQAGDPRGDELAKAFVSAGLSIDVTEKITAVQWGKLMMNLNNAINALSGIPLQEELSDRGYRRCLAAAISEGLHVLKATKQDYHSPLKAPLSWVPVVLRSPTPIFRRIAKAMLTVAPGARSSMWDDLDRKRKTEIDFLNGEIVRLASSQGLEAPVNAAIVALIREAEEACVGSPMLSSEAMQQQLHLQ